MKQKFTIHIADLQLSIVTDATPAEVEKIRGLLDRKMREIYLKSHCPKTEAAMLCAMDFAAERMTLQEQNADLTERCEKYAIVLENIKERNAEQAEELERLRNENAVLRSLLTKDNASTPIAPNPISPTEFLSKVADAQHESDIEPTAEEPLPDEVAAEDVRRSRSRVGAMFDLLSFGEAD